jgi:crotonobetainyl-CoA:carnitine CoA-transferase CaiB-like acyl-CoA transferase
MGFLIRMLKLFKDLKVIDLSTVLAGPSVATFFAELGAEVIKIENKQTNDVTRTWKLDQEKNHQISAYFSSVNYLKNYLFLNLKDLNDREIFYKEIANADIVISNFKLKDEEKLGVSDFQLRKINPQLIIGKISGFGKDSDRVAYDLILQAETGFMGMNGTKDSGPVKMPVALIDVLAAHQLKEGLLLALLNLRSGAQANTIHVSLYDAAVCSLMNQASNYLMVGQVPKRIGSLHPNIAPYGEIFETKDRQRITFAIGSDLHFEKLCHYLKLDALIVDDRFKSNVDRVNNRDLLFEFLKQEIANYNAEELLSDMEKLFVPVGKIKMLDEVFKSSSAQKLIREELINGEQTKRLTSIAFQWQE